jgi:hypothetical protein
MISPLLVPLSSESGSEWSLEEEAISRRWLARRTLRSRQIWIPGEDHPHADPNEILTSLTFPRTKAQRQKIEAIYRNLPCWRIYYKLANWRKEGDRGNACAYARTWNKSIPQGQHALADVLRWTCMCGRYSWPSGHECFHCVHPATEEDIDIYWHAKTSLLASTGFPIAATKELTRFCMSDTGYTVARQRVRKGVIRHVLLAPDSPFVVLTYCGGDRDGNYSITKDMIDIVLDYVWTWRKPVSNNVE